MSLQTKNLKIHFSGADTIPSKTFRVFLKPSKKIVNKKMLKHRSEGWDFYNPSKTFKTKVAKLAKL